MTSSHMTHEKIYRAFSHASGIFFFPHISMCKRAVERYNNEPKRVRQNQPAYTQGPLDEVFGQHLAFPLDAQTPDDDDAQVYQYLSNVRKEAETDRVCYFVERESKSNQTTQLKRTEPGLSPLSKEYMAKVTEKLDSEKRKSQKTNQESTHSFSLGELDFTLEETTEDYKLEDAQNHLPPGHAIEVQPVKSDINNSIPEPNQASPSSPRRMYTIPESAAKWRELVFTNPAPPQEYFQNVLEHSTVIKLIVYYTKWLLAAMPESLEDWIFATFVRLDCGLDHQELAIVRALGVKAQKLRAKFLEGVAAGADVSKVAQLCVDMILVVVSQYFGQRDLVNID